MINSLLTQDQYVFVIRVAECRRQFPLGAARLFVGFPGPWDKKNNSAILEMCFAHNSMGAKSSKAITQCSTPCLLCIGNLLAESVWMVFSNPAEICKRRETAAVPLAEASVDNVLYQWIASMKHASIAPSGSDSQTLMPLARNKIGLYCELALV